MENILLNSKQEVLLGKEDLGLGLYELEQSLEDSSSSDEEDDDDSVDYESESDSRGAEDDTVSTTADEGGSS